MISVDDSKNIIDFTLDIPDGVYSWVPDLDNFPESSSNLGILELTENQELHAVSYARSSSGSKMKELNENFSKIARKYDIMSVNVTKSAEAWEYDPNNKLLQIAKESYSDLFNKEIKVSPVHAGAECDTFAVLKPGIDIIAIGPIITDPHSINECCNIDTILPTWQLLEAVMENLMA